MLFYGFFLVLIVMGFGYILLDCFLFIRRCFIKRFDLEFFGNYGNYNDNNSNSNYNKKLSLCSFIILRLFLYFLLDYNLKYC